MSRVVWHGEKFARDLDGKLGVAMAKIGVVVEAAMKRSMSGNRGVQDATGRYVSLPGQPPAVQTGRLRASVTNEVAEDRKSVRIGTNTKYAKWLEFGTRWIAPRPFMRPALDASVATIQRILAGVGQTAAQTSIGQAE